LEDGELMLFDRVIANPPFSRAPRHARVEVAMDQRLPKN
jgi:hypothetical protein